MKIKKSDSLNVNGNHEKILRQQNKNNNDNNNNNNN